ncbi:MAG: putative hydro-lyase [Chloroflexi bacterium]|nr:putative hydro-lyase [Chloroflexota bacterium]MCL5108792.1 putative hydro-lyase [Chloroflexota bacterium]
MEDYLNPAVVRQAIRSGFWRRPTAGLAPDYAQANLVVLPQRLAFDFMLFCQRNPKPCPLLDVTDVGSPNPQLLAPAADLRTDIPRYRVYREGRLDGEVDDLLGLWRPDLVAFLLGCSFTFEAALLANGIPVRHIEEGVNVPMFVTSVACLPAGIFHGPLVVTMRPIPEDRVVRAVQVTSRFPGVHGAPVHIGDPARLGIRDLAKPDYGDAVTVREGEVPVFWACGVTPQAVALEAKPELLISHAPGHMFVSDLKSETLAVL